MSLPASPRSRVHRRVRHRLEQGGTIGHFATVRSISGLSDKMLSEIDRRVVERKRLRDLEKIVGSLTTVRVSRGYHQILELHKAGIANLHLLAFSFLDS